MEGISRRAAIALSVVALLALPIGVWTATAKPHTFKTNVSIHYDKKDGSIWGHLGTASFCQDGRTVTVFHDGSVAGVTTSSRGFWSVDSTGPGSYRAVADARNATGYGSDHSCLSGSSKTITVP